MTNLSELLPADNPLRHGAFGLALAAARTGMAPPQISELLDVYAVLSKKPHTTQDTIARKLHISQTTVARRLAAIRELAHMDLRQVEWSGVDPLQKELFA